MAVVNAGHGVEQVGQMGGSRIKHGGSLVVSGGGVGHGHPAFFRRTAGKLHRPRQLRGHVHNAQQSLRRVIQPQKSVPVRQTQICRILGASFLPGEKRSLHLNAHQSGPVRKALPAQPRRSVKGLIQCVIGQGHGGRSEGGDAPPGQIPGHTHQARIVPVGEVRTGAAVNVDIHQPRDHQRPVQILRRARDILQHMGKLPVFHREASPDEPSVRKNPTVFVPHITHLPRAGRGPHFS